MFGLTCDFYIGELYILAMIKVDIFSTIPGYINMYKIVFSTLRTTVTKVIFNN